MSNTAKDKQLEVTSLQELSSYAKGALVELPPFADGQPFVARIKRPSMLVLMKKGKIPNQLLQTASGLFGGKGINYEDEESLNQMFDLLDIMAEACFVEPKLSELKELEIDLTDDQYMFIFNYSQQGVKALDSFRRE